MWADCLLVPEHLRKCSGGSQRIRRTSKRGQLSEPNIFNFKSCKFITWTLALTVTLIIGLDLSSLKFALANDDQHANMFDDQLVAPLNRAPLRAGPSAEVVNSLGGVPATGTTHQRAMNSKLHIIRLFAPEAIQNGTQNVTLDCMFKFDPKLDQRLTIKWYFNDELEPIYQWIPELNKRVYSDRYEHLIDKSYQVTDDVDWMLQAYKKLTLVHAGGPSGEAMDLPVEEFVSVSGGGVVTGSEDDRRKLLANRLHRLAKLGGERSRALLATLRSALAMDSERASKFRALRLIKPPLELAGRFTCSVSSLDGDDLASTQLLIYEPPKSFSFNVTRTPSAHLYNLTCAAGPTFPRPSLALVRYRGGGGGGGSGQSSGDLRAPVAVGSSTQLRPELVGGVQTQLKISASRAPRRVDTFATSPVDRLEPATSNQIVASPTTTINLDDMEPDEEEEFRRLPVNQQLISPFEISAWALVDESSLSSNSVTQFECVLTLDGTNYEQRQSLALQKGWHVNSQALMARSTLVGLMSVLASMLCLIVALVSALLVFKLMRRHANKTQRVHHQTVEPKSPQTNRSCADLLESNGTDSSTTTSGSSPLASSLTVVDEPRQLAQPQPRTSQMSKDLKTQRQQVRYSSFGHQQQQQQQNAFQSDGIYRVPSDGGGPHYAAVQMGGTRFAPHHLTANNNSQGWSSAAAPTYTEQNRGQLSGILRASGSNRGEQVARATPATISVNGKQLYC